MRPSRDEGKLKHMSAPFTGTSALLEAAHREAHQGRDPMVVLDLDGTLYDCTARSWQILREYREVHGDSCPSVAAALDRLDPSNVEYTVEDTLTQVGIDDPSVIEQVVSFWQERFFRDDYVLFDVPLPGAVPFVRALFENGIVLCYLTGRTVPDMLVGTVRALLRDGFPIGTVRSQLVLKATVEQADLEHKRTTATYLAQRFAVIGAFDNEPGLCNLFREAFPHARVVQIGTVHRPDAPALAAGIERAPDFLSLVIESDAARIPSGSHG